MKKLIFVVFLLLLVGCAKEDVIITTLNEGYDIVTVDTSWDDSGCVMSVNDEQTYNMAIDQNGISISQLGEYEVIYKKVFNEIEYTCTRIVKVVDDIAPVVSLLIGLDTIVVGEDWIDGGITTLDNYDDDKWEDACESLLRAQEIVTEAMTGLQTASSDLAKKLAEDKATEDCCKNIQVVKNLF